RLEIVQQAALVAVRQDFVVYVQENLRRQRLDLEAHLIADAEHTRDLVALLAAQLMIDKPALLRQKLIAGGGNFGKVNVAAFPGDDVPGPSDAHGQVGAVVLNLAHGKDVKQLGVQRPAKNLEYQVADPRTDEEDAHDGTFRPHTAGDGSRASFDYRLLRGPSQCFFTRGRVERNCLATLGPCGLPSLVQARRGQETRAGRCNGEPAAGADGAGGPPPP